MPPPVPPGQRERIKEEVLTAIAGPLRVRSAGQAKYRVGPHLVHVRFCSPQIARPSHYKFNINPNTLSADFELWICGAATRYYLIPMSVIAAMYGHPAAYVDSRYPKIRVVSINTDDHVAQYASPGVRVDLTPYLLATLGGS